MYQGTDPTRPASPEPASHAPLFETTRLSPGRHLLKVEGDFTPGWLARLSAGLSGHRVSILRGWGRRVRASRWEAEFEIEMAPGAGDPADLDFAAFVRRAAPATGVDDLELTALRVGPDPGDARAVLVEVEGPDRIGFLQSLLKCFSLFSLFPCELEVATDGASARDRFTLRGIAGSVPSAEAVEGLREQLEDCLIPPGR